MIYCVEDEPAIRNMMLYTLMAAGYEADGVDSMKTLFDRIGKCVPRLIILDLSLPQEETGNALSALKADPVTKNIPIIMARGKGMAAESAVTADDYLTKPFGMLEMLSHVKAVIKRTEPEPECRVYKLGPLSLDTSSHSVTVNDKEVKLTIKEYEILYLLLQEPEKIHSRFELMKSVWGINAVGKTRTVDVHIATLRMKIGNAARYIETIRGEGYRVRHEG